MSKYLKAEREVYLEQFREYCLTKYKTQHQCYFYNRVAKMFLEKLDKETLLNKELKSLSIVDSFFSMEYYMVHHIENIDRYRREHAYVLRRLRRVCFDIDM